MDSMVWVEVPIEEFVKNTPTKGWYYFLFSDNSVSIEYLYYTPNTLNVNDTLVTHVLLKKPLSEVIKDKMPTDEEIKDYFKESCDDPNNGIDDTCYSKRDGAKWLRDKLLNNG